MKVGIAVGPWVFGLGPQGFESGLTGKNSEDFAEVVFVPTGSFSAKLDGSLVFCGADEIDGEVSDDGHVLCAMALSQPRLIVLEDNVEGPVEGVFDEPMAAHGLCRCWCVKFGRRDEVAGIETAAIFQFGP